MKHSRYFLLGTLLLAAGCAAGRAGPSGAPEFLPAPAALQTFLSDTALMDRVAALDANRLSGRDVSEILSKCPSPRLLAFNGSAFDTMSPFARFLRGMGYPQVQVRSSYADARKTAGQVLDYQKTERLRPILIGHSQGGAFVVKVLHELDLPAVSFASAIATGKWMRVLLGQWDLLPRLRRIPDSVEDFAGYRLARDWIGSDAPLLKESGDYEAEGKAAVRNIRLEGPGHLDVTRLDPLLSEPALRAQIEDYVPGPVPPADARLFFAADIWYHVKKHWCLELQALIREHRQKSNDAV